MHASATRTARRSTAQRSTVSRSAAQRGARESANCITHLACPRIQGCAIRSAREARWLAGFTSAREMKSTRPGDIKSGKLGGLLRIARIVSSRVDCAASRCCAMDTVAAAPGGGAADGAVAAKRAESGAASADRRPPQQHKAAEAAASSQPPAVAPCQRAAARLPARTPARPTPTSPPPACTRARSAPCCRWAGACRGTPAPGDAARAGADVRQL